MLPVKLRSIVESLSLRMRWLLVVAWMAVIFWFSDQPNSSQVTEQIFGLANFSVRKAAHIAEFAILFLLVRLALTPTLAQADRSQAEQCSGKRSALAFLLSISYACLDEMHQSYIPGRSAAVDDVGIDAIGPFTMLAIFAINKRCREKLGLLHKQAGKADIQGQE